MQLLLLGKLCKGSLDLPKWVTSRVDRDFRIDQGKIAECQDVAREMREKRKRPAGGKSRGKGKGSKKKKKGSASSSSKAKYAGSREASLFCSFFSAVQCTNILNVKHLSFISRGRQSRLQTDLAWPQGS